MWRSDKIANDGVCMRYYLKLWKGVFPEEDTTSLWYHFNNVYPSPNHERSPGKSTK